MSYQQAWEELKEWLSRSQIIIKEFIDDDEISNDRYFSFRLGEKLRTTRMIYNKMDRLEKYLLMMEDVNL